MKKKKESVNKNNGDLYKDITISSPQVLFEIDSKGKLTFSNPKGFEMFGYSQEELDRGLKAVNMLVKEDRNSAKKSIATILMGKKIGAQEYTALRKDGSKFPVIVYTSPILYKKIPVGIRGMLVDITERKKMEGLLLNLYKTSTQLQETKTVNDIIDMALSTFNEFGFDRVRFYLYDHIENILIGKKAIGTRNNVISKVRIPVTKDHKKTYYCINEKRPIIDHGVKLSEYKDMLGKKGITESASLPLISSGKVIGIISVDNKYSKKIIKEDNLEFLMTFTNQIATTIENAQLYDKYDKRLKKLSTLYDVSKLITSTLDLEKVLNLIVLRIVKIMKIPTCSLLLIDDQKKYLLPKSLYDSTNTYVKRGPVPIKKSISGEVINTLSPIFITDVNKSKQLHYKEWAKKAKIKTLLSIPLKIENKGIGVINLYTKSDRDYSEDEIELLITLANQAAVIIDNSRLYERIKNDKENLSSLLEASQVINSTLDFDNLLRKILDYSITLTSSDFGALLLIEDGLLVLKQSFSNLGFDSAKLKLKLSEGTSGWVARNKKALIVPDVKIDKRYMMISPLIKSSATIPIIVQDKIIGVLDLESMNYDNYKRFQKSLNILINQIGISLENAMLYQEINNFNEKLQDEIEIATQKLREQNIELKKVDKMKSEFVSNVSHELRTPLTSILGYAKILINERQGELAPEQKDSLKIIIEESDRLSRLINDVLDLAKLETGEISYKVETVDIVDIATRTLNTVMMIAQEKNIKLKFTLGKNVPVISSNRDLLKQVFLNLLNNAIKFTAVNGKVEVKIKKKKNFVELRVKDNGCGIPEDAIPRLFDKFYQVDASMTRKHGGTGLGLPIVKHIIDLHKGTIEVKSIINKGSEFIIELPIENKEIKK